PYEGAEADIARRCQGLAVLAESARLPARLAAGLKASAARLIERPRPTAAMKAVKSAAELEALKSAMIDDGAALCELYAWLEAELAAGARLTEDCVAARLDALRARARDFIEPSFETICAAGPNAAEPHYAPAAGASAELAPGTFLLIDSGGQYGRGTTDVTRTTAVGELTLAQKRDYTAVLMGHIELAAARFPAGCLPSQLDTVARKPLWDNGLDYGHGTGHGVGFCLCVHEGPCHISPKAPRGDEARLRPGLVLSNEPGVYRAGLWGVRTENLVTPVEAPAVEGACGAGGWLAFETLTLCPIDTRPVIRAMLGMRQACWLNAYHRRVRALLAPRLSPAARAWLERATEPV
ncbi:MAG: M24 family metallopeptidase, partial [Duodenibacillus sp.]|nr:M24 family metallopeptidase [Duodenibacillus sp.]